MVDRCKVSTLGHFGWQLLMMPTLGVGDLTAEFLATFGITEERYRAVKTALHLNSTCGCSDRKQWLNAVGEKLGISDAATAMMQ